MSKSTVQRSDLAAAAKALADILHITPLTKSAALSSLYGRNIYFKWENKFRTGSFKERGAVNFLSHLSKQQRTKGVCAASAGNHALALSYHASNMKVPCHIFMPVTAPLVKVQTTKSFGANVMLQGDTFHQACEHAMQFAKKKGLLFVSPFNHPWIVAGQSTCGTEMLEQCPQMDSLIAPVGGGGLLAGSAMAIKLKRPEVFTLGVQSEWAAQKKWQTPADIAIRPHSIADGIAVKELGEVTAPLIERYVDCMTTVSENEIARAMVQCLEVERAVIEGAAAAALAALPKDLLPDRCQHTVVIISGSNVDMNVLSRLLERDMGDKGRLLKVAVSVPDRPGTLFTTAGVLAKSGANVLQVLHDRSFSKIPGNVDITFQLEVRDVLHREEVLRELKVKGFLVRVLEE
ncbi:MAG: pyridoxal-phosphate dependent enzyme [Deltaproteobacteria bacterium]|nr:pyridoxal-phosphate dependent enzyme [Deltaproteobacteria bacterium]